jgi:hypothetical protein
MTSATSLPPLGEHRPKGLLDLSLHGGRPIAAPPGHPPPPSLPSTTVQGPDPDPTLDVDEWINDLRSPSPLGEAMQWALLSRSSDVSLCQPDAETS